MEAVTGAAVSFILEEEHHRRWPNVNVPWKQQKSSSYLYWLVSSGSWSKEDCSLLWSVDSTVSIGGGGGSKGSFLVGWGLVEAPALRPSIHHVQPTTLQHILDQHTNVFKPELGTL